MNLTNLQTIPLAPEQCVIGFGVTLIVAPHADDESLGCGGLIALLRKYGQNVYIVLLSDGTLSHPNSKIYPAERLRETRENELIAAAECMGVSADHLIFCRYPDRNVPHLQHEGFPKAVDQISHMLQQLKPQSIFVPWRRDPHPDHRAASELFFAADTIHAKIYEYPVWLEELGTAEDQPTEDEVMPFRLDITSVLETKKKAIFSHQTQLSDLIHDDPEGFRLSAEMLRRFDIPYEIFFISK